MSKWDERSIANLLPLSVSQNFQTALKEWHCSGEMRMLDEMNCELCGKKDLHYQFEIANALTEKCLWVGSSCIQKFDIYLEDEDGYEVKTGKAAYLNKKFKIRHVVDTLLKLLDTQPEGMIGIHRKAELDNRCANLFRLNRKFTPKQVNYIFLRLQEEGIPHEPKYFSISNSSSNWDMLMNLKEPQFRRILQALTISQRDGWMIRNKRESL